MINPTTCRGRSCVALLQTLSWIAYAVACHASFICLSPALCAQALPMRTISTLPATIVETSGLIYTRPNRLWTHNDSGGEPKLYEIDTTGAILRTVVVRGVTNIDWEDICQDAMGRVYVGDFGNNDNNRTDLVILKLPPLDSVIGDTVTPERIDFDYADQSAFPPADPLKNFDMEAFVAYGDSLYLFSKNRTVPFDGYTKLYRLPQAAGNYSAALIDSFYTGAGPMLSYWIAGAALNPQRDQLLLASYGRCFLFSCFQGADFFGGAVVERTWAFTQKEAVAWRDDTHLYVTDELLNQTLGGKLYEADMSALAQLPLADLGPDTTHVGDTLLLAAPSNPGSTYLWSTGATTASVALTQSGSYWLQVTAPNGCVASDTITLSLLVQAPEATQAGLHMACTPNPFSQQTYVHITCAVAGDLQWRLLDALGNVVRAGAGTLAPASVVVPTYDFVIGDALGAGLYLLEVKTLAGWAVTKVIAL
jgi:hypothetical protein